MAEREIFKLTSKRIDAGHPLGALVPLGRFEWEQIILRCKFAQTGVKHVGLTAATWATTTTGANVRPGIALLSATTGLSDRPVRRYLKELERFGLLHLVNSGSNFGRAGKGMASMYQLTAPEAFALSYEAERGAETWRLNDQWDMRSVLEQMNQAAADDGSRPDHRSTATDDNYESPVTSDRSYAKNTGHLELSPVISDISPVISSTITGHQRPPNSVITPQESSFQEINPHKQPSSFSQLTRESTQKTAAAKNSPKNIDDENSISEEQNRQRQMAALQELMKAEQL